MATYPCGSQPGRLALRPDGHDLWVLGQDGNLRRVTFDFTTNPPTLTAMSDGVSTLGGHNPIAILAPADDRCYVLNRDNAVIGVIGATDLSLVRMIPTAGSAPCAWAMTSTQTLWLADKEGDCLGLIDASTDQSEGHIQLKGAPVAVEISSSGMSP